MSASSVTVRVPAKVNLVLEVGPPLPDGYHQLATVFHAVSLFDEVTATELEGPEADPDVDVTVTVEGPGADEVPRDDSNLAVRAAVLLSEYAAGHRPVRLHISKGIPVAGGMAGGSADAAAALVACEALWQTGIGRPRLLELAAELGSDVPFALLGGTAIGSGRGDRLTPALARGDYHWVVALADRGLSTPMVYKELDRLRSGRILPEPRVPDAMMQALRRSDPETVGALLSNDLQNAAVSLYPELDRTLAVGSEYGALGGIVSGSGPTVVFLARDTEHALDLSVALTASGAASDVRRARGPVHGARVVETGQDDLMAHLLNAEGVTVTFAARRLLDAVSLGLDDGDRVGVVGRNGDGKSTLLRVLARAQAPDAGRVTHSTGITVGMLGQTDDLDPGADVRTAVVGPADAVPDHVWAADAAIRDVFAGLLGGLDAEAVGGPSARVGDLSGGQRRRVALAALLVRRDDVLLLDEPTNHLDVEGVDWLAAHLRSRWPAGRGALVVVTHDRWFLDAVCERTWEVHGGTVDAFDGGYAAYVLARAERARIANVTQERRSNLLRKELAWLRRGAPARTSKPRFRLDAAAALVADEPPPRDRLALERMATARLGKDVIDLEGVSLRLGDQELLRDVTWRLAPGERIGIVGVNGSGKTSLLRLLLGSLAPTAGRVRRGKTVRTAMLTQEVLELDAPDLAGLRVQEAVEQVKGSVRIGDRDVTAGQLLENLGFARERVWTPVRELSGGERRRLQLLRLLMGEPNVLALDEPTNDLDTDTLAAVEDALDGWPGTLLVVSHDRYLLERLCDRELALLGDGRIRDLPGGVEEYLALRRAVVSASAGTAPPERAEGSSSGDIRAARKELARLERQLSRLADAEHKLHTQLAEKATDHEAVLELDAKLRALQDERMRLEEEWLEAAELTG